MRQIEEWKELQFEIYQSYPCIALRVETENLLLKSFRKCEKVAWSHRMNFPIVSVIKFICLIKFLCFVLRCLNESLDVLKFTLSIKWIRLFIV